MPKKPLVIASLVVAGALTLAACGSDNGGSTSGMGGMGSSNSSSPSPGDGTATDFSPADVTFATQMIPHHRQAVEMAKLADTRADSGEVKDLATQIANAQGPEIQTMSGWLGDWGRPVPSDTSSDMSGMNMSDGATMPGMMSDEDMNSLMNATGADFDHMFLTMMIEHHQGALTMAKTEQRDGTNTDAIALAQKIESAQTDEITTMRGLLK